MALCALCEESSEFVDAHVIPEAFFRRIGVEGETLRILTNAKGEHSKRSPKGVYDQKLLCKTCEPIFGAWDNYAVTVHDLIPDGLEPIPVNATPRAYTLRRFDYTKLKLFFVSLLWRAAASRLNFYRRIDIGRFEITAKELILRRQSGDDQQFSVALATFDDSRGRLIFDPFLEDIDGVRYAIFYLNRVIAYIKVDKKITPGALSVVSMKPGSPLVILARDFRSSPEFSTAIDVIRASKY